MVSARIPTELRDSVHLRLREMGSSPSELINLAYLTFLESGKLPSVQAHITPGTRKLSPEKSKALKQTIMETSLAVPESFFGDLSDDQLLSQALEAEYETLA